ncbi:MAG: MCE family protein [Gemmatimonadetes bacterium]|nr:MCE family protein [Gemmatimonadota bacterium]
MKRTNEIVVGAVIVLGIALLIFGTLWLQGVGFGREEVVTQARFREVGQLLHGNAVKLRGVPIGRVEDIYLESGGEWVIVAMKIESDVVLPVDPVVLLAPESMFGDWQAEIFPRSRYPLYDYSESTDPQVIPGYALPDISRLTAVADQIAGNLAVLTERVEIAFTEETALNVRRAIENIQEVSEQLTGLVDKQQRTMDQVAANLETTTRTLGEAAETVRRAFAQVEAAISHGELAAIIDDVQRTTAQLDSLSNVMTAASQDFRSTVQRADSTFRIVHSIATAVRSGEGTAGRLLQDTTLYSELRQTNALVRALVEDFQKNPRKYINLSIF